MFLNTVYKYSKCIQIHYLNTQYLITAQLWKDPSEDELDPNIIEWGSNRTKKDPNGPKEVQIGLDLHRIRQMRFSIEMT